MPSRYDRKGICMSFSPPQLECWPFIYLLESVQSSRSRLCSFKQMILINRASLSLHATPLVKARKAHQPFFTSRAVRQATNVLSRLKPIAPVRQWASEPCLGATDTETLSDVRQSLLQRLRSVVLTSSKSAVTSGANRQIRHNGIFAVNYSQVGAREKTKETLQSTTGSVSLHMFFHSRYDVIQHRIMTGICYSSHKSLCSPTGHPRKHDYCKYFGHPSTSTQPLCRCDTPIQEK